MSTSRQKAWQRRSNMLFRIKGIPTYNRLCQAPMTEKEKRLIQEITSRVHILISESVESSRQLGFNAKYRDIWHKVIKDDERNNIHQGQ